MHLTNNIASKYNYFIRFLFNFQEVFKIFPYLVSIQILSAVSKTKPKILRKMYEQILSDDCVPLTEIPIYQQDAYIKDYLLHDRYVDIDLMQCVSCSSTSTAFNDAEDLPDSLYLSVGVQSFFQRTNLVREALHIQNAYAADRTVTARLTDLAIANHTTYRTLMRERSRFMKHTSLMNLLSDPNKGEDTTDRYRNCCFYCRDYIIAQHESAGRPTDNSILRETKKLASFPCTKCPYHPNVKAAAHGKNDYVPSAICRRNATHMVVPNTRHTVNAITNRIPEQETYMAWAGVRAWMSLS